MKIAKRFELYHAVASDPRVKIKTQSKEVPLMVAVVLDWDRVIMARELQVPEAIINRVPVGDLIDGSSDEQNFGCTYDELRWYTDIGRTHHDGPNGEHTEFMVQKFEKLDGLHHKNFHKYATKEITHYNPVFL